MPIGIKTTKQFQPIGIKKFPEREELIKKCANVKKYSRTGYFVRKSYNIHNVKHNKSMLNDSLIRL